MKKDSEIVRILREEERLEKLSDNDINSLVDALKPEDLVDFARGAKLSILAKALMRNPRLVTLARHLL